MRSAKPRLIPLVAALLIAVVPGWSLAQENRLASMSVVAENKWLRLYLDPKTAEFAVEELATGAVWYSNPPDRETAERLARGRAMGVLTSQLSIVYFTPGDLERRMDNYNDSVLYGQFEISEIENGVRILFQMGVEFEPLAVLPALITKESWDRFLQGIESDQARRQIEQVWSRNYTLVSLVPRAEDEAPVQLVNIDPSVFGDYKLVGVERSLTATQTRDQMRNLTNIIFAARGDLERRDQMTGVDLDPFRDRQFYILNERVPQFMLESMEDLLIANGFRIEHKQAEYEMLGLDPPLRNLETFQVPIEYKLDGDAFVVRVPVSEIEYPVNVVDAGGKFGPRGQIVTLPINRIHLLEFFGAAGRGDTGYLFVPDGSGAIIHLNNGKTAHAPYVSPVYGVNLTESLIGEKIGSRQQIHLPVFGMKRGDRAFLAIIEKGDALARIRADVAGRAYSYNTISAEFITIPQGVTGLRGDVTLARGRPQGIKERINVYQSRIYQGDIQIRYKFLHGEKANYIGMAEAYREHLIQSGVLKKSPERATGQPMILELIGAIDKRRPILGVPRNVIEPLTTYRQAQRIVADLLTAGVGSLKVRFRGWMKGGLRHVFPSGVEIEPALGGRAEFVRLSEYLRQNGIQFYPDVEFFRVHRDRLMDGFFAPIHAARRLDRTAAADFTYNPATFQRDGTRSTYLLSPSRLVSVADDFLRRYAPFGTGGLSLGDLGRDLYSDFRRDERLVDRQSALEIVAGQLGKMRESGLALMVAGGNAYTLRAADTVVSIPLTSSEYHLFDASVPFFPAVLRGYVDYAGEPLNLAPNHRIALLKSIETGAALSYTWSYREAEAIKDSDYHALYAIYYRAWFDDAVRLHEEVVAPLNAVWGEEIAGHERLADGVYRTTYGNGVQIYVNYNKEPAEVDGVRVEAEWFRVVEGSGANVSES